MGALAIATSQCRGASIAGKAARPVSQGVVAEPAALSTPALCSAVESLCLTERRTEWLLCRHLAELASRFERRDPALGSYSDIYQLARLRFRLGVRRTRERVRIGRALARLAQIERGFVSGALSYSQVRELTRVATASDEVDWLRVAAEVPLRVLERRVAEASGPAEHDKTREPARLTWTSPASLELRMDLPAGAWALLERAMEGARRASETPLSDAEALEAVARDALGRQAEGHDRGDVRHMVVLYECKSCARTEVETGAGPLELDAAAAARLGCTATRRDLSVEGTAAAASGCVASPGHFGSSSDRSMSDFARPDPGLPAAIRRAVLLRDRMRCRAPGCRRRRYVDVHHIHPRELGGAHARSNCITLCTGCHDRVHDGRLRIEGDADGEPVFRGAGGERLDWVGMGVTPGGHEVEPPLPEEAQRLLDVMGARGGWLMDTLSEASRLSVPQVSAGVLALELSGRIRKGAHGYEVMRGS
jgi:hypothetical protein